MNDFWNRITTILSEVLKRTTCEKAYRRNLNVIEYCVYYSFNCIVFSCLFGTLCALKKVRNVIKVLFIVCMRVNSNVVLLTSAMFAIIPHRLAQILPSSSCSFRSITASLTIPNLNAAIALASKFVFKKWLLVFVIMNHSYCYLNYH